VNGEDGVVFFAVRSSSGGEVASPQDGGDFTREAPARDNEAATARSSQCSSSQCQQPVPAAAAAKQQLEEVETDLMPLSGEAIRMMNYVDDVATTMRRLLAVAPTLTPEERRRVSEYLRASTPNAAEVLAALDKK